ncbi:hypothetical protein EVAR_25000_1 [Eumeta japonica]|uniref:G-patch domain-containing protein n=1 Tax=Eumeta variegata TaxID=151549 RepID=A0A4C1XK63_EUMVA|nr:hypothetical protein EVAR_25000_1 [Eumeta japonica]
MGWSKGEGLGKDNQGDTEPGLVRPVFNFGLSAALNSDPGLALDFASCPISNSDCDIDHGSDFDKTRDI